MRKRPLPYRLSGALLCLAGIAAHVALPLGANGAVPTQFGNPTNFPIGSYPGSMTVADFNNDGKSDVAVVRSSGVSLLLGLGDGTLTPFTNFSVSTASAALAVADFNSDGNLDIVVAASYSTHILFGDGAGHFSVSTNLGSYTYPAAIALGDFNGDGKLDLAVANNSSIAVSFGHGDGSLAARTNYTISNGVMDIRAGDLNGNGRLSLVVSLSSYSSANSNALCILVNKGDGTFAAPQYYAVPGGAYQSHGSLELGDFNGDGRLDIAVLNYNAQSTTIWTNNGNGVFARAHDYLLGISPTSIAKGDFNGDGKVDLVVRGGNVATLLSGNGDGSFTIASQMNLASDAYPYKTLVAADFDGNETPDLAFVNYSGNSVAIMLNQTPPTLQLTPLTGYNQISWPNTFGAGFSLEYTTNLSSAGGWQPFPYPPVVIGNQKAVADWADQDRKFYRLRKPVP